MKSLDCRHSSRRRFSPRHCLLGMVIGLAIGSPLVLVNDAQARSRCHKRLCPVTFHLKPHARRFWRPRDHWQMGERVWVRVIVHGQLLSPQPFGPCAAQFAAYGVVVVVQSCSTHRLSFILTDVGRRAVAVTVAYAFLGGDIAD